MASVNKAMLLGRLTRDPEVKHIPSGAAVATFGLATDKFSRGEKSTDFHNIVCWDNEKGRKLATLAAEYLFKGSQAYIEGRIQTREWEAQDGTKRRSTEIVASDIQLLGDNKKRERAASDDPEAEAEDVFK